MVALLSDQFRKSHLISAQVRTHQHHTRSNAASPKPPQNKSLGFACTTRLSRFSVSLGIISISLGSSALIVFAPQRRISTRMRPVVDVVFMLFSLQMCRLVVGHKGCGFSRDLAEEFRAQRQEHAFKTAVMHRRLQEAANGDVKGFHRLQPQSPEPIRFYVDYQTDGMEEERQKLLKDKIIPISLKVLQELIKVKKPIIGRLTLPVTCTSMYVPGNECAEVLDPIDGHCGHSSLNRDHYGAYEICSYDSLFQFSCETHSFGNGVPEADFVLYVTSLDSQSCGVGTAAFAHHCETDVETHRPLSGAINMCPSFFKESETMMQQIETVIHEILHALVFNPDLWEHFIDDDGNKIPPSEVFVTATRASGDFQAIISKHAVEAAQLHFGCANLVAVPLENQGTAGTAGAHWDSRYLQGELMDPVAGPSPLYNRHVVSNITLGLIHDSGWYIPEYSKAGHLAWGKDAGCDFLSLSCQQYAEQNPGQKYFCGKELTPACVPDNTAVGQCSLNDETMNGCMVVIPFINADCLQNDASDTANDLSSSIFLESFGPQSRCLGVEAPFFRRFYGFNSLVLPFRCYKHFCIDDELYVDIAGMSARCPAGSMVDLKSSFADLGYTQGKLGPCPDNAKMCASLSCPGHCGARGFCDNGQCRCFLGYKGPDCSLQVCLTDGNCPNTEDCENGACMGSDESRQTPSFEIPMSISPGPSGSPVSLDITTPTDGEDNPGTQSEQESTPKKKLLQVEAELATSLQIFESFIRPSYRDALASAAGVVTSAVMITSVEEVSGDSDDDSNPTPVGEEDENSTSSAQSRGLKQQSVVSVTSQINTGEASSDEDLASTQQQLEANWDSVVVDKLDNLGVTVLAVDISTVEDEETPDEEKKAEDIFESLVDLVHRDYIILAGISVASAGALALFCWCICCQSTKHHRQASFSAISQIPETREAPSRPPPPKHLAYIQECAPDGELSSVEMGSPLSK